MTKTIGIIGGMGPAATVEFMRRIVAATPAEDDVDHLHVIADNNPKIPSRLKAILEGTGESPVPVLREMAQRLVAAGADFLSIPCNTAHYYLPDIADAVDVPVVDVIAETLDLLAQRSPPIRRVGLLASPALRKVGLLDRRFAEGGVNILHPSAEGEATLERIIRAIKAGGATAADMTAYTDVARSLEAAGAEALLVACTELSLLPAPLQSLPAFDTLDVLVAAVIARAA